MESSRAFGSSSVAKGEEGWLQGAVGLRKGDLTWVGRGMSAGEYREVSLKEVAEQS